jgi:hypothetical protein
MHNPARHRRALNGGQNELLLFFAEVYAVLRCDNMANLPNALTTSRTNRKPINVLKERFGGIDEDE